MPVGVVEESVAPMRINGFYARRDGVRGFYTRQDEAHYVLR